MSTHAVDHHCAARRVQSNHFTSAQWEVRRIPQDFSDAEVVNRVNRALLLCEVRPSPDYDARNHSRGLVNRLPQVTTVPGWNHREAADNLVDVRDGTYEGDRAASVVQNALGHRLATDTVADPTLKLIYGHALPGLGPGLPPTRTVLNMVVNRHDAGEQVRVFLISRPPLPMNRLILRNI